jgi:uncharacterized linocin/CFP29 family protein
MNILKKSLAPITDKAWEEITRQANRMFNIYLTARKVVDIEGPNGLEMGGVSTGRVFLPEGQSPEGIHYGIREYLPLVEVRKPFELNIWELDNVNRGARDIDLGPLEQAARELSLFEENAIYNGFEPGHIKGMKESSEYPKSAFPKNPDELLLALAEHITGLRKNGVEGPYDFIVHDQKWQGLMNLAKGYPLVKQLRRLIEGKIIVNHVNENSFMVSERGEDLELVLGQDLSLGYDDHNTKKVKLYFTESLTFLVLSPESYVVM